MKEIKDTVRSHVRVAFDGNVHKTFRGTGAKQRYETEVKVLRYLERVGCDFVPRLMDCDDQQLYLVTTNCGSPVEKMSEAKMKSLFDELAQFGVRHGDEDLRNVTYDSRKGRFCLIDFELAEIVNPQPVD